MGTTVEASILSAVEKLEGDRVRDRNEGFDDLKRILDQSGGTSGVNGLNEHVFHKILEVLFRIIRTEKPVYARASKPTSRTNAASRLETAAKALKLVIQVSGHRLKHKTINAVLDHIIDTLPSNDEGFCTPIESHYLTIFRTILEHAQHIEHLRPKQWQSYVDFVVGGIEMSIQTTLQDEDDDVLSISSRQTTRASSRARTVPFRSQSSNGQLPEEVSGGPVAELLMSLNCLTSVTNAPLTTRMIQISETMISWIETTQRLHEGAFEVLNNLLPLALTESVTLASTIFNQVATSIQRLWNTQTKSLKDQMIVTLYYSRYIYMGNSSDMLYTDQSVLDSLIGTIWSDLDKSKDLNKSNDQEMLHLDDITFVDITNTPPLSLKGLSPASEGSRITTAWSTLSILASLIIGLDSRKQGSEPTDEPEGPRKRRKLESPIEEVLHQAYNSTGRARIIALQLALFIVDQTDSVSMDMSAQIRRLGDFLAEDDLLTISWLFILLARCAQLFDITSPDVQDFWQRVWASASRASSSASYCRSACYLMERLLVSGVMKPTLSGQLISESIFSEGSNGPGALTDTAITLITLVLRDNFINTDKQLKSFSSRALRWLELHWTIPLVPDRSHKQLAVFGQPHLLHSFLLAVTGHNHDLNKSVSLVTAGAIYGAGYIDERDLAFTRFLLKRADKSDLPVTNTIACSIVTSGSTKHAFQHSAVVINMLSSKVKLFHHAWQILAGESASNVNADIADIAATACILLVVMVGRFGTLQANSEVPLSVTPLWQEVCAFCSRRTGEDFQALLGRIGFRLMQIESSDPVILQGLTASRTYLVDTLLALTAKVISSQDLADPDLIAPTATHVLRLTRADRQDLPIPNNIHTSYTQILLSLKLDSVRGRAAVSADTNAMSKIIDEFIALDAEELLLSRGMLVKILEGDAVIKREDACRLLEHLAIVYLRDDQFERCEVALCFCLQVLLNLSNLWISTEEDALSDLAYDIYDWYLNVILNKSIASKRVFLSISSLMERVLQCDPSYAHDSLPSPRTTMLKILKQGQNALRFNVTPQLSRLFDGYVLSEHSAIFDDIVENLPSNPDQIEDIAARLHVFSHLGARWHTILRQAVYHIFETAANVPSISSKARDCIKSMCRVLKIQQPQALLRQFSSQVLFTWLEKESIDIIPYQAFGYADLSDLIRDMQDEFVAQIAMRGSTENAERLVYHTTSAWAALLESSFPKVVAYALISDVSGRRSSQQIGRAETFLIDQLGEDRYTTLLREYFPETVAIILVRLGDDRGFDKVWGEHSRSSPVVLRFEEMCGYSSSKMNLPSGQQPSLRAKYLMQVLERLCSHAGVAQDKLWTPATVVSACRMLLDDTRPTFGPLHACAVLRKIRILICLASEVTTTGYPLEMLLHNLRPFLTQFYCSEDALGMFRYLLEHGRPFLQSNLPFISGLGVSIFASLSEFVTSPQDSTTQESHYNSTMTQAQEFRKWLGDFLSGLGTQKLHITASATYIEIVRSAKEISKGGSSSKSTPEGTLLYNLLVDQASDQPLLSSIFFRLTLRSLCHDFSASVEYEDDILTDDQDVIRLTSVLWSVLTNFEAQTTFRAWIAQAMGRAYALQGPEKVFGPTSVIGQPSSTLSHLDQQHSYHRIMAVLTDQVWVDSRSSASAAERTLQAIFSSIPPNDKIEAFASFQDYPLFDQLRFDESRCPRPSLATERVDDNLLLQSFEQQTECKKWASQLAIDVCRGDSHNPVLASLTHILRVVPSLAMTILPQIVHIVLLSEFEGQRKVRDLLSTILSRVLSVDEIFLPNHAALALDIILYLRRCVMPSETAMAQRNTWLVIDFQLAAVAAARCKLHQTALLMLEVNVSQNALLTSRSSRRSSYGGLAVPQDLLANIYHHVDDPDFFYGMLQETDVASVVAKLCHEGDGHKALSFQSALLDANVKSCGMSTISEQVASSTVAALTLARYYGLARSLAQQTASHSSGTDMDKDMHTSMNLQQWDTWQLGDSEGGTASVSNAFQILSTASEKSAVLNAIDKGLLHLTKHLDGEIIHLPQKIHLCGSLAVLSELKETVQVPTPEFLDVLLDRRAQIKTWSRRASFDNVEPILLGREASFGAIRENKRLQGNLGMIPRQSLLLEIKTLRASLDLGHAHERSQFCLNRAAYLSDLAPKAEELGLKVKSAIQYDLANTLWTQNEATASITILQNLHADGNSHEQTILISQSEILTDLGQKLTQARLDRPDEVTSQYLQPAIKALGDHTTGSNAGRVYHNFAAFCDQQLRDPDNLEEYSRIEKLRSRKRKEVEDLEAMKKVKEGKERDLVKSHLVKAQTWFKLDDQEWKRLKKHREELIGDCLENYLRAMRACDDFPNDVLRFLALWLDQSANEGANATVREYLPSVPSIKFAPLVNQLSSRILDAGDSFQRLLFDLLYRISNEHPFHSLYQVFATSKSKGQKGDTVATSRYAAATKLADAIMKKGPASGIWISIHNSNIGFVRIATDRVPDKELKTGAKLQLRALPSGVKLQQTIQDLHHKIPPPTMNIPLQADRDYTSMPTLSGFDSSITIAGGVSAPKIVTALASDGSRHKMLLKGGNDDLRQDSIMEQVFEQVSNLLGDHRATRQRRLGIRTYKVIPLTHNAGIIEFVKNTMPLHDYVLPAHTRYFPKDYKPNRCRKEISDAQSKSLNQRLQAYRNVCANFHPVMRFFFMEHFLNPDEWFQKRLNYSRSTAAISMLGHVLGLGDRHGHNILLDTNTGEVVHIDLGVAFEAGRILPVPEVVPFRLTRDLVDGMGLSGVEGVFRRCCNFSLEALRQDQEAIITILDVLRWDPLYSWSISPLRLQRMQENEQQAANSETAAGGAKDARMPNGADLSVIGKRDMSEPGEADRALAVVAKKLGKSLSVEATVNELIRQATDERNLAVLYCGWAAYA